VFFFIAFRWNSVTGGDDGLTGWSRQALDLGFANIDIAGNGTTFYYLVLALFAAAVGIMAVLFALAFRQDAARHTRERTPRTIPPAFRSSSISGCRS
jgi:hypothetical protein